MIRPSVPFRTASLVMLLAPLAPAQSVNVVDKGLLPGDSSIGPAPNSQADLVIEKGGDQYLAAWTDFRARSSGSQTIQSDADVFGIRLDQTGAPIDSTPFLIAGGMGFQQRPKIAWNGENWLVIYESQDPTLPPVTYYETYIRAVRVSAQGQTLDATPLSFPPDLFTPSTIGLTISGVGGQWLVARCVYHNDGYGTYLAGQRIGANGQLIDTAPVMLNDWVYGSLQVAAQNGEYLVVGPEWNNSSILKARRIAADLQPLAPSFNLPPVTQGLGTSGTELYVTWIANFTDLVGSRMTNTGTLLNPAGTMLYPNFSGSLDITHDGSRWWIARVLNAASLLRLDGAGNRLDPIGGVPLPITITGSVTSLYTPQLVPRSNGGVLFSWVDYRAALGSDSNGFAIPVSSTNVAGAEQCVTTSVRNQRNAGVTMGPGGTLAAAFVSELANDDRVLVRMLDSSGAPLGAPIEVGSAPTIGTCGIAWNGSLFMITWDQSGTGASPTGIVAQRLSPAGALLGGPVPVMPGMAPSIAALGEDFCIAGTRFATYPQFIDLWANRIDGPTGSPLDGPNGVPLAGGYFSGLTRTRSDGTQWLVATHSQWTHDSSQGDAVLARVPATGTPPPAVNPTPYAGGTGDLDIAYSGSVYLLVWRSNSLANANNYIAGRIMSANGSYGPAFTIAEAAGRQLRPTAVWDGTNFLVAWDDQRDQSSFYDARTDIYAARVSEAGVLLDPSGFPVVAGPQASCSTALVGGGGRTVLASTRFSISPPLNAYRIGVSTIGGTTCPADLDNGSGTGTPDHAVDIDDLLYFLGLYETGAPAGDLDNGSGTGTPDGGVDINDLLFFLAHYESGC